MRRSNSKGLGRRYNDDDGARAMDRKRPTRATCVHFEHFQTSEKSHLPVQYQYGTYRSFERKHCNSFSFVNWFQFYWTLTFNLQSTAESNARSLSIYYQLTSLHQLGFMIQSRKRKWTMSTKARTVRNILGAHYKYSSFSFIVETQRAPSPWTLVSNARSRSTSCVKASSIAETIHKFLQKRKIFLPAWS